MVSLLLLIALSVAAILWEALGAADVPQSSDCLCSPTIFGGRSMRDALLEETSMDEKGRTECSRNYLFGTNRVGTDLFRKTITGWAGYIVPGILVILVSVSIGCLLGVFMGYYKTTPGAHLAAIIANTFNVYPPLIFLILVVHILNPSLAVVAAAFGLTEASRLASSIVNKIDVLHREEFVTAAREMGVPDRQIIIKHILWYNCREMLMSHTVFAVSGFIMAEIYLGYLNVGNMHAWGELVAPQALGSLEHPWLLYLPTTIIVLAIVALHILGEGIMREANSEGGPI